MDLLTILTALRTPPPPPTVVDRAIVLTAALAYRAAGISFIPIKADGTKMPAWSMLPAVTTAQGEVLRPWRPYQSRLPTEEEVRGWYEAWVTPGIAVITGAISGGLECVDFDDADSFKPWAEAVHSAVPYVFDRLVFVRSPRPGVHVYFRTTEPGKNTILAQRMNIDEQLLLPTAKTLIETRGEGGYVLVPPSPAWCHPSRLSYSYLTPRTLLDVQVISVNDRKLLLDAARALHELSPPPPPTVPTRQTGRQPDRRLPGDDYNARADWPELLRRYGWTYVGQGAEETQHWRRPGKSDGVSATINYAGNNMLHVFSSNAFPLEQGRSYTPFNFIALMHYGGDFERAARGLRVQGYGQQRLPPGRRVVERRQ